MPTDSTSSTTPEPWTVREYPPSDWLFRDYVAAAIGHDDLTMLKGDGRRWTERADQNSHWHRRFYNFFSKWDNVYRDFIRGIVAPWVGEPFYFQRVPTFRVHLPGNVAVGTFHTDAKYHHPLGEVTYWLTLTPAYSSNTVWIADDDDVIRPANVQPGQVVEFSAVTRRHGNKVNKTQHSRVSFDFRVLPTRLLPEIEGPPSENTKLRFVPGGYYDLETVTP